jgi:hypothetical protein
MKYGISAPENDFAKALIGRGFVWSCTDFIAKLG